MKWLKIIESKGFTAFFFAFSFLILFAISDHYFGWTSGNREEGRMVRSDAACYYGYMPQWYIYQTSNFEFIDSISKKYPNEGFEDNYGVRQQGGHTNKYFCGTAILSSPFFLAGHLHAKIIETDEDGYLWPYLMWVNIGSIFYGLLGVFAIFLIGKNWGFRKWKIYFTLIAILYGTNLFFYTTIDIPYSHVYCFSTTVWMIYTLMKWKDTGSSIWKIVFFILVGLAIIIRPTNILALAFAPFLWDSWKSFWIWLKLQFTKEWKSTLIGLVLFGLVVLIQFYNVYIQYNLFQFNVYANEGFDHWKSPYIISTLFGFNKGLFIYSPILLLIFPGCYFLFKWNRYRFLGFVLTFVIVIYVISSWWCWWYGGAFGLRAYVDFYGLFALPLLVLFERVRNVGFLLMLPFMFLSLYLHQTFDTQYKNNIIIYDGMTYEKFKLVFLKTEPRYSWLCFRNIDTLSNEFKALGSVNKMYDPKNGKEVNYFNFKDIDEFSLPSSKIIFSKEISSKDQVFAYRFKGKANIHGNGVYLSLVTTGFQNGKAVFEMDHPYGHIPEKIDSWCDVSCDVVTDWKLKDLDSVKIKYYYTATYSEIKLDYIMWGGDKKPILR